jgi:hypothetical protein
LISKQKDSQESNEESDYDEQDSLISKQKITGIGTVKKKDNNNNNNQGLGTKVVLNCSSCSTLGQAVEALYLDHTRTDGAYTLLCCFSSTVHVRANGLMERVWLHCKHLMP